MTARYDRAIEEANEAWEAAAAHWDNVGCCFLFVEEWAAVARSQLEEARDKLTELKRAVIICRGNNG